MSTSNSTDPDGTIPVDDAIQYAANWRAYLASSGQAFIAQSFLIPIINFQNILLYNPNADGVNAYIGLDDPMDPLSAKLLLVPTVDGQEVVTLPPGSGNGGGVGGPGGSNVYDFTTVCPPTCKPPDPPDNCTLGG